MASYEQVTYNSPDGAIIGKSSTEKIGFYGTTPVVQASYSALLGTVTFSAAYTGMWAFSSSTVATSVCTKIDAILTALQNIGIMAAS